MTDGERPVDSGFLVLSCAKLMGGRATVVQSKTQAEGSAFVNAFLSEVTTASTRDREAIRDQRAAT